jgi:predicted Zn-dependent peptidase
MASFLGSQEALHQRVLTMDEVMAAMHEVTAADIQALAARLVREEALCAAAIGPDLDASGLEAALRLP